MAILHVADSAGHLGMGGPVAAVAAAAGIAVGALVVFGLPSFMDRRKSNVSEQLVDTDHTDQT